MDSKGVKMQIYNIETKAIISEEEMKELDDCFILTNTDERNDMQGNTMAQHLTIVVI